MNTVAVLGPGRIGRQIALAFALGGRRVLLVDVKARTPEERRAVFADARREITRDLRLMTEEGVIAGGDVASALDRIERSEEHTSELQSQSNLVCRLLLEKKKKK